MNSDRIVFVRKNSNGKANVYHLTEDCLAIKQTASRRVERGKIPNHMLCMHCDPNVTVNPKPITSRSWNERLGVCNDCGRDIRPTRDRCEWCENYALLHAQPRDLPVIQLPEWWDQPTLLRS